MKQTNSIRRILEKYPYLYKRSLGFPYVGNRIDNKEFSKEVKNVSDGFSLYNDIMDKYYSPSTDLNFTSGNPLNYKLFPPVKKALINTVLSNDLYKYPYSEGDDKVRYELLKYIEKEGFHNNTPYEYEDIDDKGLSIHNITFTVSTSHAFDIVIDTIARENDVILMTGPNYGLFSFKPERKGVNVDIISLDKEDNYLINPDKLDIKIKDINRKLEEKYKNIGGGVNGTYIPRVVAFVNGNPCNPTGKVMGKNQIDILKKLGDVCVKNDIFIIDDLIYRDITYNKNNIALPMASLDGVFKHTISLFGLSKSYGLASFRAGFVVADEVIIRQIINKIFQQMDAVPVIIGESLKGAFEITKKRNREYNKYFKKLNFNYLYRYQLLKALVMGLDSVDKRFRKSIIKDVKSTNKGALSILRRGISGINIIDNLEPEAGFFVILDFTELKGKKYDNILIDSEETLVRLFYKTIHLRFIIGKSIAWPNYNQLIGRFTFAKDISEIINAFVNVDKLINRINNQNML